MAATAVKDPAIKLFGRTICLPESQFSDDSEILDNRSSLIAKEETEECRNENTVIPDQAVSTKRAITAQTTMKPKDQQEDSDSAGEQKQMRRPDKILPCPRCNSSDTKFCYFNNYNVNQPRHFCKSCQRYWTAGGTVRNVPVGAGRRRNKHLASQYRQVIASSDGGETMVAEVTDSENQLRSCEESSSSCTGSSSKEMVLKFGPESPHCDNSTPNLLSNRQSNECSEIRGVNGDFPQLYHYVVPPQVTGSSPHSNGSVSLAVPGYASPNVSYQIVPAAYMNCIPVWVAGSGNLSLAMSNGCVSPSLYSSGSRLQVLGKHSRDINQAHERRTEEGAAPKTIKIHGLDEA
ncbi:hypothetical protein SOVF_071320 [Spinacia oleracea]|nr:hypothetical protein SOVF_071320 [Spinacia oleracea]